MRTLTLDEIECVSGGAGRGRLTENQCIGAMTLLGGIVGGLATGMGTWGLGTAAGWGLGMAGGGAVGMLVCAYGDGKGK